MSANDVTQIRVGKHSTGIIGLIQVLEEVANEYGGRPDDEIQTELFTRLSKRNYISEKAKDSYGQAFFREFKKFIGELLEEDESETIEIKVLGPGCYRCNKLEQDLIEVMAEMNLAAGIEHITDINEIGSYGVMGMPALVINGKVKAAGSVPPKSKLKTWLKETVDQSVYNKR